MTFCSKYIIPHDVWNMKQTLQWIGFVCLCVSCKAFQNFLIFFSQQPANIPNTSCIFIWSTLKDKKRGGTYRQVINMISWPSYRWRCLPHIAFTRSLNFVHRCLCPCSRQSSVVVVVVVALAPPLDDTTFSNISSSFPISNSFCKSEFPPTCSIATRKQKQQYICL